jgi:DNA-binding CsgD family transcriptional regulator
VLIRTKLGVISSVDYSNSPPSYEEYYRSEADGKADPVLRHTTTSNLPIAWSQQTYVATGAGNLWEIQAPFGYRNGIATSIVLPNSGRFIFGLDTSNSIPLHPDQLSRTIADIQLLAVHANEAAANITPDPTIPKDVPRLSVREVEALKWTMDGKTAWEVSRLLGVSEGTAVKHLNSAQQKLDCVNKHQAVIKAIKLGIISL